MEKDFKPYFLVYKTENGLYLWSYESLGELYKFIHSHSEIIGYSVFKTLESFSF